jgi:16S rRNA (guanine527-N7)-methyltransferase
MTLFKKTLTEELSRLNIQYDKTVIDRCAEFYEIVVEANKYLNLTRITDEAQAAQQHFADAMVLCCALDLPQGSRVIDIGTGAGFPGVPLKLLRPDLQMTLLDASGKKTDFLKDALAHMNVAADVICGRAEELARGPLRESFDVALLRAIAMMPMLLELAVPLLKNGGMLAAWKGETFAQELKDAESALDELACKLFESFAVGRGAILLIQKEKPTPDIYPRRFSKIKSLPL